MKHTEILADCSYSVCIVKNANIWHNSVMHWQLLNRHTKLSEVLKKGLKLKNKKQKKNKTIDPIVQRWLPVLLLSPVYLRSLSMFSADLSSTGSHVCLIEIHWSSVKTALFQCRLLYIYIYNVLRFRPVLHVM